jgi:hypothetical protein
MCMVCVDVSSSLLEKTHLKFLLRGWNSTDTVHKVVVVVIAWSKEGVRTASLGSPPFHSLPE